MFKKTPDFVKIFLKQTAYRLYKISSKFFTGPFDKYDFQTIQIIRTYLHKNSNCIDIGANAGHILREIIKAAPDGHHLAFEPLPDLFSLLKKKYGFKATLYSYALSDKEETVEFSYYKNRPAVSGFKERAFLGKQEVIKIEVKTKRLDELLPDNIPIDLIKIDVEGAEHLVLKGAISTLRKYKPVVLFECGLGGADEYNTTPEQLYDLFDSCGLSISLMEYFLNKKQPFTQDEFCGQFYKGYNYFFIAYDKSKMT